MKDNSKKLKNTADNLLCNSPNIIRIITDNTGINTIIRICIGGLLISTKDQDHKRLNKDLDVPDPQPVPLPVFRLIIRNLPMKIHNTFLITEPKLVRKLVLPNAQT